MSEARPEKKLVEHNEERIPIPKGIDLDELLSTPSPTIWTDAFVKNSHGPWWEQCK